MKIYLKVRGIIRLKKSMFMVSLIGLAIFFLGCEHEYITDLDKELTASLNLTSKTGTYEGYIMPSSTDYASLPNQDVKNPVTAEKVALGKMLFFETGIALQPKYPVSLEAYSCKSTPPWRDCRRQCQRTRCRSPRQR